MVSKLFDVSRGWIVAVFVFVLGLTLSVPSVFATTWTEDERVFGTPNSVTYLGPWATADGEQNTHVVCTAYPGEGSNIVYKKLNETGWSDEEVVTANGYFPNVTADDNGSVHVVWLARPEGEMNTGVYYRQRGADSWGSIFRVSSDSTQAWELTICSGSNGIVHVSWTANNELFYRRLVGGGWSTEMVLDTSLSFDPFLARGIDGAVELFWAKGSTHREVWWRHWDGVSWGTSEQVTYTDHAGYQGVAAVDAQGIIHLAYHEEVQDLWGTYHGISYQRWEGGSWTLRESLISTWAVGYDRPTIACDSLGLVHILWASRRSGNQALLHYRNWDGFQWSPGLILSHPDHNSNHPNAAVDADNYLHVLWVDDREGTPQVYHKLRKHCLDGDAYADCRNYQDGNPLFDTRYTAPADTFSAPPGEPVYYDSTMVTITRGVNDRFYLTGSYGALSEWIADDRVYIDGQNAGLGFDGVLDPTLPVCRPIEEVLSGVPPRDVTDLIPMGTNCVTFKLADTQREVLGNTQIYLWRVDAAGVEEVSDRLEPGLSVSPNPSTSGAKIQFVPSHSGPYSLTIYSAAGREIRSLPAQRLTAGQLVTVDWDGQDDKGQQVGPGVYFFTSTGGGEARRSAKVLIVR